MSESRAGINLLSLKDHNTALVLSSLRAAGEAGVTQSVLAASAGLTPQAISKIVGRLSRGGLVVSAGLAASTGGKRASLLKLQASARQAVGIHLDRHYATFVLDDLAGNELARKTVSIGMSEPVESVYKLIETNVRSLIGSGRRFGGGDVASAGMLGIGIACPGPLDASTGVLGPVRHLPQWHGVALRDEVSERLGAEVVVIKDTDAAARGVLEVGVETGNRVYVHFGDGLGAGLILDGEVYQPRSEYAGEFGHQVIDLRGPRCDCGRRGCIEAVCLQALAEGRPERAAEILATALANLDLLLGLDRVALGGSVIDEHSSLFRNAVDKALSESSPDFRSGSIQIMAATHEAAAHGAAAQILDKVFSS